MNAQRCDPPAYFEPIRQASAQRWNQLEGDPELAGPWLQLFKQVQNPRNVLSELLQNAVDHEFPIGSGGGQVKVVLSNEAGTLTIRVIDDGLGVPADFAIDQANGLGLTIVRTLVTTELVDSTKLDGIWSFVLRENPVPTVGMNEALARTTSWAEIAGASLSAFSPRLASRAMSTACCIVRGRVARAPWAGADWARVSIELIGPAAKTAVKSRNAA